MNKPTKTVIYGHGDHWSNYNRPNRVTLLAAPWEVETGAKPGPRLVVDNLKSLILLAHPTRFELVASAFGGQR